MELQLNYKQSCKASGIKNNIIIFTILFFWNFVIAHAMIVVLPTKEQALLILPVFGRLNSPRHFSLLTNWEAFVPWMCQNRSTSDSEAENRKIPAFFSFSSNQTTKLNSRGHGTPPKKTLFENFWILLANCQEMNTATTWGKKHASQKQDPCCVTQSELGVVLPPPA